MRTFQIIRLLVVFLTVASTAVAAPPDIGQSKEVATAWLAKLDADDFSTCWSLLATDLRNKVARWRWNLQCRMGRLAMGKAVARKLRSVERETKTAAGRTGEFVAVRFDTQSEKNGPVIEILSIQEDHDGQLRVGGYAVATEKPDKP